MDKKKSANFFDEAVIKISQPGNEDQSTILAHLPIYQTKVGPDGKITILNQFKAENIEKHRTPTGKIVKISLSDVPTKTASINSAPSGIAADNNHDREKFVIKSSGQLSSDNLLNRSLKSEGKPNIYIQQMNNKLVSLKIKPSTPQQSPQPFSHNISLLQKQIPAVIKPIMSINTSKSPISLAASDTKITSGNLPQFLVEQQQEPKKILNFINKKLPTLANKIQNSSSGNKFSCDSNKHNEIPKIIISNGKSTKIVSSKPIILNKRKSNQHTSVKIHKNNNCGTDQSQLSQQFNSNVTISKISTMVQKKDEIQQPVFRQILEPSPLVTIEKKIQQLYNSTSPNSEISPEVKTDSIYLEGTNSAKNFASIKEKQNKSANGCFINIYQQHLDKEKKRCRRNSIDGISPLRKKFNIMLNNFPKISLKNSTETNTDSLEKTALNIKLKNQNNSTNSQPTKVPLITDEILKKFHVAAAKTATDIVTKRYKVPFNTVIKKINNSNTEKLNNENGSSNVSELVCENTISSSDAENSNSSTTKSTSNCVENTKIGNTINTSDNSYVTSQNDCVFKKNNIENLERSPRGRSKSLNLIGCNSEVIKRALSAETDNIGPDNVETDNVGIDQEINKLSPDNETDEMKLLCAEKIQVSPDSSKSTTQLIQTINPSLIKKKNIVIVTKEQFAAATAQHTQAMMDYEPIKQEILELNKSDLPSPPPAESVFFFDSKSLNTNNSFAENDTIKPIVSDLNFLADSIYNPLKEIKSTTVSTSNGKTTIFVDEEKLKKFHHLQKLHHFQQIKMQQASSAAQIQQEQFNQLQMQSYEINKKSQQLEEKLKKLQVSQKSEKSPNIVLQQNLQFHQEYLTSTPKPKDLNDLHSVLNWQNEIGITKDSRLPFQLNEFGLLEFHEKIILDRNQIGPENYSSPIFAREHKSQNTADYGENLYFCEGCKCHGAAVDFLAPNFCSKACILRIEKKKHCELKDGSMRRDGIKREKKSRRLNNWLAPKLNISDSRRSITSQSSPPKRIFTWPTYLESSKAEPAGIDLFLNPFPCGPNQFQIGMKLESIDPENMSLFCVSTIVEKKGFRLKLHFDKYPSIYDFWVNADSMDIFPPGWCNKTNRILMPPKNTTRLEFNWSSYLIKTKSQAAPRHLFTHLNTSSLTNPFKVGMKFEADDLRNSRMVCVASVADVLDNRILVHFDGWDNSYDYWVDCTSPYIHPVNWHLVNNFDIVSPPNWQKKFLWKDYLQETSGIPATEELFHTRFPIGFKPGMKLELVDKKNPSLIRPGTVIMAEDYELTVIYDGWPSDYAFSVIDDNLDIHPIGWCEATGHELESPPGFESLPSIMPCPMPGCRGIGNTRYDVEFHATLEECPYNLSNWSKEIEKPTRVQMSDFDVFESRINKRKINDCNLDNDIKPKILKSDFLNNFTMNHNKSTLSAEAIKSNIFSNTSVDSAFSVAPVLEEQDETDQKPFLDPRIKISKKLLIDYGPRLEQNHIFWLRNYTNIFCNAPFDNHNTTEKNQNPLLWSTIDVYEFIKEIPECGKVAEMFRSEDIDGEAFLALRQTDLIEIMQLKLGPAVKIYNRIIYLRGEVVSKINDEKLDDFQTFGNLMNGDT